MLALYSVYISEAIISSHMNGRHNGCNICGEFIYNQITKTKHIYFMSFWSERFLLRKWLLFYWCHQTLHIAVLYFPLIWVVRHINRNTRLWNLSTEIPDYEIYQHKNPIVKYINNKNQLWNIPTQVPNEQLKRSSCWANQTINIRKIPQIIFCKKFWTYITKIVNINKKIQQIIFCEKVWTFITKSTQRGGGGLLQVLFSSAAFLFQNIDIANICFPHLQCHATIRYQHHKCSSYFQFLIWENN